MREFVINIVKPKISEVETTGIYIIESQFIQVEGLNISLMKSLAE